jgi:hypothetical protein
MTNPCTSVYLISTGALSLARTGHKATRKAEGMSDEDVKFHIVPRKVSPMWTDDYPLLLNEFNVVLNQSTSHYAYCYE